MYLRDDEGKIIDVEYGLEQIEGTQSIIVECHWGTNDKKGTRERNPDYNQLLGYIFGRLAQLGTKITRVIVDSKRAAANFTIEGRTVKIDYPVDLTAVNIDKFRKALQNAVRKTARKKQQVVVATAAKEFESF
ncbi:MAG: hypothetical protein P8O70_22170 [SAR324 cluster bacterium]|nr:hypothetical protein [SAR324 cluster bacterium]